MLKKAAFAVVTVSNLSLLALFSGVAEGGYQQSESQSSKNSAQQILDGLAKVHQAIRRPGESCGSAVTPPSSVQVEVSCYGLDETTHRRDRSADGGTKFVPHLKANSASFADDRYFAVMGNPRTMAERAETMRSKHHYMCMTNPSTGCHTAGMPIDTGGTRKRQYDLSWRMCKDLGAKSGGDPMALYSVRAFECTYETAEDFLKADPCAHGTAMLPSYPLQASN